MSKLKFRSLPALPEKPQYPTLEKFDSNRREFLLRIGGAIFGAGATMSLLTACEGRSIPLKPDGGQPPISGNVPVLDARTDPDVHELAGEPLQPDARADVGTDVHELAGGAPAPDARVDTRPDVHEIAGDPIQPDARVDTRPDAHQLAGVAPEPDAKIDDLSAPTPGLIPQPGAKKDSGGCPLP